MGLIRKHFECSRCTSPSLFNTQLNKFEPPTMGHVDGMLFTMLFLRFSSCASAYPKYKYGIKRKQYFHTKYICTANASRTCQTRLFVWRTTLFLPLPFFFLMPILVMWITNLFCMHSNRSIAG